jgi:adenylate cyclase
MTNVLIVEDKEENRKAYKLFLDDAKLGWNISTAKDENEAKDILPKIKPEAIVTDLVMNNENSGMDLLRAAKEYDPFVMVIIVTAFDKALDRYKAFELGAFDCILKGVPGVVTGQEILVKVKTALQFRQLTLDQLESQKKMLFYKRYFDPKVLDTIDKNPKLLEIQNRVLTVVFWDIRGFSSLCEALKANPLLISGFLKDYFQIASEVIFKNHGVLDKFVGDGVMALFGAFNGKNDNGKEDAKCAVRASFELKNRFNELLHQWIEQWALYSPNKISIGIACGVHTGEVLVGNVGTDLRDQFTALGPHVNFASRILGRALSDQVLISATTSVRVKCLCEVRNVATWNDVKNIPGQFEIFEAKELNKS